MADFLQSNGIWALPLFGLFIGVFAGLTGLGGGAVLVPLLVLLFAKEQQDAQGTSLAMIFSPGAIPAIYTYHQKGHVDWWLVIKVAPFMLVGSYIGARFAVNLPKELLRVIVGLVLVYVAAYMVFGKSGDIGKVVLLSFMPVLLAVILAFAAGVFSQAWQSHKKAQAELRGATTQPAATPTAMPADEPMTDVATDPATTKPK
ncbi:MAG: sulfite exporter TauE/SafE family protein [Planctomycetota bacterium]